jgi:tetratricopeptide (TPR) repeat protein
VNIAQVLKNPRLGRLALVVAGAIAIVALIAAGAWAWYQSRESRGEAALADATALVEQATGAQATPDARAKAIAALEAVLRDHPRFSGAPQAAYELGNLRYAAGQYSEARAAYELALAKGATGSIKTLSALGIGYTWEAEKNSGNAAAAYEAALKTMSSTDFAYEDALIALARTQQLAGNTAGAIATYERLLKEVPQTHRADDLRTRIAGLKSRSNQ